VAQDEQEQFKANIAHAFKLNISNNYFAFLSCADWDPSDKAAF
jgi:hypothetical protein